MPEVVMPRLSDSMEEGTVLKWLKAEGDVVQRGDELVEIETDKATMTYEADQDGVLEIVAQEGDTLPIGQVIARIGGAAANGAGAESPSAAPSAASDAPSPGADTKDGAATAEAEGSHVGAAAAEATDGAQDGDAGADGQDGAAAVDGHGTRVKASPVARRIARENGVDLAALQGSGPGGRIVKADVQAAASQAAAPGAPAQREADEPARPQPEPAPSRSAQGAPAAADTGTAKGEITEQELTRTQQLVARRMAESKATIPDFTLQSEVDMEACVALRAQLKELELPAVPTYNDMVVKACALALRGYPRANGSYRDGRFELHSRVNVGVAVAAQDALVVPTLFDADVKSLAAIAAETRALAGRVREATITPPELSGGTFTVSNLGMYGVSSFTAVINPPQAAILSVGSLGQRAVVRDGELVARHTMNVTLACDHRILYGADAAEFLARIRGLLEQPLSLAF
jgi:pyruvate dehydrogenase E2 component (dihydrolipoamide acetyltransferase)